MFEVRLTVPSVLPRSEIGQLEYDPELDDLGSVLRDICEALEAAGVGFHVRVCSDEYWPVTVRTDLLVVIEQLGDALGLLAQGQVGKLEFYEQGVERVVLLTPCGGEFLIQCNDLIVKPTSHTDTVSVSCELVLKELVGLADDFLRVSKICCGQLASHHWFVEWADGLQQQMEKLRKSKGE
ncbi:hypothetical protein WMF45_37975 [Sorangium sp. So ce448]|uniref:hypothetical protein n=1 Tax=Sorangium sp. So ce448 TaxID=3133314 RepID=UPI003F602B11